MRLLLIEDDQSLANGMITALKRGGYAVDHTSKGIEGLSLFRAIPPDLLILDLGLPDISGIEVLKSLRQNKHDTPILILTARDAIDEKIAGLDAGADDYMTKPFAVDELMARLRVLGRRNAPALSSEITVGELSLNLANHEIQYRGVTTALSRREFSLLRALAERPGQVFSREQLEEKLYSWGEAVSSNTIDVHIHNLRKKLSQELIKNIRGVGYTLRTNP
ncbi:Transcriptional regulatory protein QseB [Zhongshania aliphaticivorans]|uniref:Transcriptional regulatory protein QseB n=1 Tax=Zhongshania aliphaticivorans TaxID=1470434 RepID=A0A5S9N3N2_9GAMM|nr:response regulator transcription factor [Zhongshania aliphaticivorans]CAA0082291.1 Transcriptional regulatory protein QseB [Zhongshania aliphaticivorans]CAA0084328.1 Transcriptional regulatory protein QseB [Zhongshania aliphaticivorans]